MSPSRSKRRATGERGTRERAASGGGSSASRGARRRARELVLQGLYQWLVGRNAPTAIRAQLAESPGFEKSDKPFFDALWRGVTGGFDTLIGTLHPYLDRAPEQLSPIEKAVLAIGAWELTASPETPYRVAINEAVELAKLYGGVDGHKYVNGVLDRLALETRGREVGAVRKAG